MTSYDLNILSPIEFETLSRDLIQLKFNIQLESFSEGKDLGIDFRNSENNVIVQCKRINSKNNLLGSLKKELKKVLSLNPHHYIITTSLPLSVSTKAEIISIFGMLSNAKVHVLGHEDLNNLLSQFKHIEEKYYKLWLSSTNILTRILKSRFITINNVGVQKIKDKLKIYVQNKSLDQALNLLCESNYLIISGIPGIGKTTLSEIIAYSLLAKGYEELIYINDNVDVAFELYSDSKSQVFLYDDFLGRNFLNNSLDKNEDKKIIDFIQLINGASQKKLVLTTRQYILNQAQIEYEAFDKLHIEKYILDLEKYSILDKAKILYNHFYFSNIPFEYIEPLILSRKIIEIINHPNYSPRIIETLSITKSWIKKKHNTFGNYIIGLLDNPYEIWLHAYENQISELSRMILNNLLLNPRISVIRLFSVVKCNLERINNIKISYLDFKKSCKELGNCFIKTYDYYGEIQIDFYNPSVHDFLVNYINNDKELLYEAFKNIYFINFISQTFTFKSNQNKIYIIPETISFFVDQIVFRFNELEVYFDQYENEFTELEVDLIKLINIDKIVFNLDSYYKDGIKKILHNILNQNTIHKRLKTNYLQLFIKYVDKLKLNSHQLIMMLTNDIEFIEDLETIDLILNTFPLEYEKYVEPEIERLLKPIIIQLYFSISDDNIKNYTIKRELEAIRENYKIDIEFEINEVDLRIKEVLSQENILLRNEYDIAINNDSKNILHIAVNKPESKIIKNPERNSQNDINQENQILNMFKKLHRK